MKIVLFGATGQVGQRIVQEALRRGHEVVGVTRDPSRSEAPDPRVRLVKGGATDARSVAEVVIAGLKQAGVKRLLTQF